MTTNRAKSWLVLTWVWSVLILTTVNGQTDSIVRTTTKYGPLAGIRTTMPDGSYLDRYFGVPFAKPPVGNLRFRAPEEPDSWTEERNATRKSDQCPQPALFPIPPHLVVPDNEDCLYLDVYAPKAESSSSKLPVMVWMYGGAFTTGSSYYYDSSQLAARGVVVVNINYRVDAMGFLSTGDAESPGNYGLWDSIRALQWVHDAISAFKGDPDNVTIFGESAGAGIVSILLLAKQAQGLFHRAIMQSGASVGDWATTQPGYYQGPAKVAKKMAVALNCSATDSSQAIMECLRSKEAMAIANASKEIGTPFRPVVESSFSVTDGVFTDTPENLLRAGKFSKVPTLRGFNLNEAGYFMEDKEGDGWTLEEVKTNVKTIVDQLLFTPHLDTSRITRLIMQAYFDPVDPQDHVALRQAYLKFDSDMLFIGPTWREIELSQNVSQSPHFLYRFSHRSVNSNLPAWKGVIHAADVSYVFGQPMSSGGFMSPLIFVTNWTQTDRTVSERMITLWTNFAKSGNPNIPFMDSNINVTWLPWTQDSPVYLEINDTLSMRKDGAQSVSPHLRLWTDELPRLKTGGGEKISGTWVQTLVLLFLGCCMIQF